MSSVESETREPIARQRAGWGATPVRSVRRWAGWMLLVVALMAGGPWAATLLIVREHPLEPQAIVALASHEWERLPAAARLARQHAGAAVLLTVPPTPTRFNCFDCAARVDWLGRLGVEKTRVTEIGIRERGTWGEARVLLEHCRRDGVKSLLVVTSPYHTRRSLMVFRYVFRGSGITVGVHPALGQSGAMPSRWWLHRYDREYVAYEWTATLYYVARMAEERLRGSPSRG